jgi:peptidyl-prolyl cis-trans isomerase C
VLTRKYITLTAVALSLSLMAGCQSKSSQEGTPAKKSGQVIAEVNGTTITTDDFKKEAENLPPYLRPMIETPNGKKELLDNMIVREIILQQAKKDGLDKSPAVAAKLEDLKQRVIVEAFLRKKLEEQANVSDADMKKFYDENKDKFKSGEQVRASHILVKSEAEAQEILAQLKKGGNFEELAKKHSIDGAAAKGGDLGWFSQGSMIPEFEKVAFGMKEGETSGIVKTKFGYHIIKLTGKRPAGTRSFEESKELIKAKLAPEKQQELLAKLKEDLKKGAKFSVKEDLLNSIQINPGQGQAASEEPGNK